MAQTKIQSGDLASSLALAGVPTAATAAANTNTTQLATTAFVVGQAASVAPVMDGTQTLGTSLLYARQDHVHASDTSRAPLASPTFTGTVTFPSGTWGSTLSVTGTALFGNAVTNTNNLKLAAGTTTVPPLTLQSGTNLTTAAAGNFEFDGTKLTFTPGTVRRTVQLSNRTGQTTTYTATASDSYVAVTSATSAPFTITLPAASAYSAGQALTIADESGGITAAKAITITRAGSDTINGGTSMVMNQPYFAVTLVSNGVSLWQVAGCTTNVQTFTSSGTYTPTPGMVACDVYLYGSGGGGGGGCRQVASAACSGGGGGGAACFNTGTFTAAEIGASKAVTVGAAGTAGLAATVSTTAGGAGGSGGNTSLGTLLVAGGGGGGGGAQLAASTGGGGGGGTNGTGGAGSSGAGGFSGLNGATAGSTTGGAATASFLGGGGGGGGASGAVGSAAGWSTSGYGAPGGSGGGGISAANAVFAGTQGGFPINNLVGGAGGAAGVAGTAGGNATVAGNFALDMLAGAGGGGGGSSLTAAGAGGAGGLYGAGGGGGGSVQNGGTAGAGGLGGAGIAIIIEYF